jgi:hypothetical protein
MGDFDSNSNNHNETADENRIEEVVFDTSTSFNGFSGVTSFNVGPPSTSGPADDSALIEDDLTTSLLATDTFANNSSSSSNSNSNNNTTDTTTNNGTTTSLTAARMASGARRPHSGIRLVLRKIGNILAAFILGSMLLVIPIVLYSQLSQRKLDVAAFDSAGVMVLGTVILSIRLVYLHLTHWYMPKVQKYVVRILWMVPLYAVQSWLSLRFRDARIYIDAVRDLYEGYVIASFLYYLIELLGGQDALIRNFRGKKREDPVAAEHIEQHPFPLNLVVQPWELGMEFMLQCKHGVLQYVVVKFIATALAFFFQSLDCYGEGLFQWNVAYPYLAFILNISVMYALYCLVKLFHAVNDDLRSPIDWHPLGKFLCVKGVVFFTWWQAVVIFYLQSHGIIKDIGAWTGKEVADGLIDYCVCIEMVGFAIAHAYTFPYTEYLPETVQEAMLQYSNNVDNNNNNNNSSHYSNANATGTSSARRATYRPPATLHHPMKFKDAFWSSTLPSETIQDISRLRNGVDQIISQSNDPGVISLQDFSGGGSNGEDGNGRGGRGRPQNIV